MYDDEISTSIEQIPSLANLNNNSTFIQIKEKIITLNVSIMNSLISVNNQSLGEKKKYRNITSI